MDYRKALLSTAESRAAEAAIIRQEREAKEAAIRTELEAKNILNKLPRDIRDMIWRLLLRRRGTILPGYVHWWRISSRKAGGHYYVSEEHPEKTYKYQWNELHQKASSSRSYGRWWGDYEPEFPGGRYGYGYQTVTITIPTEPTFTQRELIAGGQKSLPYTFNNQFGIQVGCDVVHRGNNGEAGPQVINRIEVDLPRLELGILRANKQALEECSQILYGENTFAFITGSSRPFDGQHVHEYDELSHFPDYIPGHPNSKNGRPQSQVKISNNLDRMFYKIIGEDGKPKGAFRPKLVARDPMLTFFWRIGRMNTSLLTKIQIEGCMKTLHKPDPDDELDNVTVHVKGLGFGRMLPFFTTILKNTCPHLRVLTLHMEDDKWNMIQYLWDDDQYGNTGKTDDERIDEVVEKVVSSLESLEVLNLGGHKSFEKPKDQEDWVYEDQWGRSARWMEIVKKRAEGRAAEKLAKKLEASWRF
ncbi:uncharacterized protein PAC_04504 [Phialocephala subalpina]|uniref:Uncharacterized protein n=1 Tax=Phialocephala subalpina TaxID=576137 RepID=A0A1L7WPC7_9HELO|nr:uncharacterized protein PAC_04504 [Phialocephala subalpina]